MMRIDGSEGEGGGQILRTSFAFSAITGAEIEIFRIRANRPKPGLANQHLTSINAVSRICDGDIEGNFLRSEEVRFRPGNIRHGEYSFDVGTAGSVTLVLQAILPPLCSTPGTSEIRIKGGTDVKWSPPVDYFRYVILPMLRTMEIDCQLDIRKRGYFPEGGGEIIMTINSPKKLAPVTFGPAAENPKIEGIINITGLPGHISERVMGSVLSQIPEAGIEVDARPAGRSRGVGLVLYTKMAGRSVGSDVLGERGLRSEEMGKRAAEKMLAYLKNDVTVDVHGCDQILPFMAVGPPGSVIRTSRMTGHAETNLAVIQRFMPSIFKTEQEGNIRIITRV